MVFAFPVCMPAKLVLRSADTDTSVNRTGLVLNVGSTSSVEKMQTFNTYLLLVMETQKIRASEVAYTP